MSTETVTYLNLQYTQADLAEASGPDLVVLYNKLSSEKVKRFGDKKSAVRRVWEALKKHSETARRSGKAPREAKTRIKRFNLVALGDPKAVKKSTATRPCLRDMLLKRLQSDDGLTFDQGVDVVKEFDRLRKEPHKNLEQRAYEGIRLVHYYANFSLKQDIEDGPIHIVPNRAR